MLELHTEHPDSERKPGDEREFNGRTYVFGQNQFSSFWRAGPKDGTINCAKDYPTLHDHPYVVSGGHYATFEKAAEQAIKRAKSEYERALEVVRRYEAPEKDAKK